MSEDGEKFLAKYLFYRYYHKDLSDMFDTMFNDFWKTDFIPKHKKRFEKMHRYLHILIRANRINYIILNFLFTIEPLFYKKRMFRIPMWVPNDENKYESPYYQLYYFYEGCICISADFVMIQFELMVVFILGICYVQMEMIKTKLKSIGTEENFNETVKQCVDHHNLILRHLEKTVSLFSLVMIQQVSAYIMAIVLPAYLFGSTRTVSVGFCICTALHILNFFLYCLAGQIVNDQCISVKEAVYNSDWWKTNNKNYKQSLIIIMLRSEKGVVFTAGGVMNFCFDTFITAMKASFSLLQFLGCQQK